MCFNLIALVVVLGTVTHCPVPHPLLKGLHHHQAEGQLLYRPVGQLTLLPQLQAHPEGTLTLPLLPKPPSQGPMVETQLMPRPPSPFARTQLVFAEMNAAVYAVMKLFNNHTKNAITKEMFKKACRLAV
jgi:hypothetical protein